MAEELRILIAEDVEDDALLIERELRRLGRPFRVRHVATEADFRRALAEFAPSLVLSDLSLPGFHGLRALAIALEQTPHAPFIFVSGNIDGEAAVELMKQGATDYVLKNHLSRLVPSIQRALREAKLAREHRRAEQKYRGIFENAVLGIYQFAPDGRYVAVNPALARLFGYDDPADMLAAVTHAAAAFANPQRGAELLAQLAAGNEVRSFEAEVFRKDRSRIWVCLHARVVPSEDGSEPLCEGFMEDTTRQRELEAQMQRAQRLESIGTLAGGVAHDLNNVISPILMAVSVVRNLATSPEHAGMISLIETSANRGAQIINQVLAFGSGGGERSERRTLQITYLIKDVLKVISDAFPNGIAVENLVERNLWPVVGDVAQLRQVLLDLCTNARDAMPNGGSLRIRACNTAIGEDDLENLPPGAKAGRYVLLDVTDTGTGIPSEIVDRIFDPFFTTKGVGKGTGLGLSAVRGIIKSHGGFVRMINAEPLGTSFQVYLPAVGKPVAPAAPPPSIPKSAGGKGETILLVDDEEGIRLAVRTVLTMHNYQVVTAATGVEALGIFMDRGPEITAVITDLMMPGMNGLELTRSLRRLRADLPVLISSGRGDKTSQAELEGTGISAVLHKPYSTDELLRTLQQLLAAPGATTPA